MSTTITEIEVELEEKLEELQRCFEDFDFKTKDNLSKFDLPVLSGFKKFMKSTGESVDFDSFCKKIKGNLFSLDDDVEVSDFDWDSLHDTYGDIIDQYDSYFILKGQIEENLTGDQTVETVDIYDADELKQKLLDALIENNLVYELNNGNSTEYMLNTVIEKKFF